MPSSHSNTVRYDRMITHLAEATVTTLTLENRSVNKKKGTRTRMAGGLKLLEFHGILGIMSMSSSLLFFGMWNETQSRTEVPHFLLAVLSMVSSTALSIHSSCIMLDQVPAQTVIYDAVGSTDSKPDGLAIKSRLGILGLLPFSKIIAPHREAFHRTSSILQYVNTRILQELVSSNRTNVSIWILTSITCIRVIPNPFSIDISNGNTFCFVIPMAGSVVADFLMTYYCAMDRINASGIQWLSLKELVFVQLSGLVIAFLFTLAFRSKRHKSDNTRRKWQFSFGVRPLYYVTTLGVNAMVVFGFAKAAGIVSETCD